MEAPSGAPSAAVAHRRATALTAALAVLCLPLLLVMRDSTWALSPLIVLGGCVALTELRPIHIARNGQRHSFTLTEGPLVAALAIDPGRWVVVSVAAGVLLAQIARGLPRYKAAFNVAQFAAATSVATLAAQLVGGSAGVLLGVLGFTLLNNSVVRLVIALTTGQPAGRLLQDTGPVWLLHVAAVTSIALLGAHVYLSDALTLPAFIAPAILVLWSQEQANKRRAHTKVVDALAAQATTFYGRSSEETALLLTRTARDVLAAARTEVVLLGDESVVLLSDGPEGTERSRLNHADLVTGWRGRVLESATATAEGTWAGAVVGRDVPRALLSIWRDAEQEEFRAADIALLQRLADTVGQWLQVSEDEEGSLLALRRRVLELGVDAKGMADALGTLARVRESLESPQTVATSTAELAEDLRDVEQRIASFIGGLMVEQRQPDDGVVATGRWVRAS